MVAFPFKQLKELKEACDKYGPTAAFTLTILDAMATEALTPADWKALAHACLMGGDYLLWKSEFYENCKRTAQINFQQQIPIPFDKLTGEGQYSDLPHQMTFQVGAYAQTNNAAKKGMEGST